jgi:hypothetical protein
MPSRHLRLSIACTLSCLVPWLVAGQQPAKPAVDQANVVLARRLLQDMHMGENMAAGIDAGLTEQRRQNNQVSSIVFDSIVARMKRTVSEVLDSIAPSYARRFTGPELQAMIVFYESPPGQSLASQQAALSIDLARFAQRWGARVAAAVMKDLADAGIDITKP